MKIDAIVDGFEARGDSQLTTSSKHSGAAVVGTAIYAICLVSWKCSQWEGVGSKVAR